MYRQLETERLLIRPLKPDDKGFILELLNTQGWLQFIGDRKVKTTEDAEQYIQRILSDNHTFYHVFELKDTKQPVGVVTLLYRDTQPFPDIGFAQLPQFGNNGYAYEASRKYLDAVIRERITRKLIALTLPDNTHSIKLIEKLGFIYESDVVGDTDVLQLYALYL